MRKRIVILAAVFLVISTASFLLWPIEKKDYNQCQSILNCQNEFTSKYGGGLYYLRHINDTESAVSQSYVKLMYSEQERSVYSFVPVPVLAASLTIGAGVSVIALIGMRVAARRSEVAQNTDKT